MIQTATSRVEWTLRLNPTVASTFTFGALANSSVEAATGATANTVTGGTTLAGGYLESGGVAAGASGSRGQTLVSSLLLGSTIAGVADRLVLCAMPIGGSTNVDVEGSLTWREIS
jgi:hypothetical protein